MSDSMRVEDQPGRVPAREIKKIPRVSCEVVIIVKATATGRLFPVTA